MKQSCRHSTAWKEEKPRGLLSEEAVMLVVLGVIICKYEERLFKEILAAWALKGFKYDISRVGNFPEISACDTEWLENF